MRVCLAVIWTVLAGLAPAPLVGQDILGIEGNWQVRWTGIEEGRPTTAQISIFRERTISCERDLLDSCQFKLSVRTPEEWVFDGRSNLDLGYGYVQNFQPDPGGQTASILHSYGIMGHWGGTENLRVTGAGQMAGQWEYRGATGTGIWQRVVPRFSAIEITSRDAVTETPLAPNRVVATLKWDKGTWPRRVTAAGNRPRFEVKLRGTNLWGYHTAVFENSPGLYPAGVRHGSDAAGPYLSIAVLIWPGLAAGTHVLNLDGQQFYIDLDIQGRPIAADLYLEAGNTTEVSPLAPLRVSRGAVTEPLIFQARDIGGQPITQLRARIHAEDPLHLQDAPPNCVAVSATEVLCDLSPSNGLFRQTLPFWAAVPSQIVARPETRAEVEAHDDVNGGWVRLGSISDTVHLRDCDGAYAARMSQIDPEELGDALRILGSSVAAMPGKRLYPGPQKPLILNAAQTYRVRLMTNQMAANKSPDAYLKSATETGGNDLGRLYLTAKQLKQSNQCVARPADLATLADLKISHASFKQRAAEVAALSTQVQQATVAVEKIAVERFKGFTGKMPSVLQTILGVGGKPLPKSGSNDGVVADWLETIGLRISEVGIANAQSRAIFLIPDILAEGVAGSASLKAAAPNFARVFGEVPGMASLMLGGTQIGVSVVDLALLTDSWTEMDELSSWIEASAYFQALDLKYVAIEAQVAALIEQLDTALAPGACTCRQ